MVNNKSVTDFFELGGPKGRMLSMEGLRGVAILLVFFCHYLIIVLPDLVLHNVNARMASETLGVGVDLFFTLSGFLIYRAACKPNLSLTSFYQRRFERIYPTFACVLVLYYALSVVHLIPSRIPHGTVHALMYILENALFLPGMLDIQATISAAWSLSYEWFFYLVLPVTLLAIGIHRYNRVTRIIGIALLALAYPIFCYIFADRFPVFHWWEASHVRLTLFFAGMLASELVRLSQVEVFVKSSDGKICAYAFLAVMLGVFLQIQYVAAHVPPPESQTLSIHIDVIRALALVIATTTLLVVMLTKGNLIERALSFAPLRYLGNMSYSVYLIHSVPLHLTYVLLQRYAHLRFEQHSLLFVAVSLPIGIVTTLVASMLLFAYVEKPFSLAKHPQSATSALTGP